MVVNKIVALLEKEISLDRVQENEVVFLSDNVEVARLGFNDKETRDKDVNLGFIHEHEISYLLKRKMLNGSGLKIHGFAFVEIDKDIKFFIDQVLEFISIDEKDIHNFTFKYSEV